MVVFEGRLARNSGTWRFEDGLLWDHLLVGELHGHVLLDLSSRLRLYLRWWDALDLLQIVAQIGQLVQVDLLRK